MIYAVLDQNKIEKVVEAEPDTPFHIIFENKTVVEVNGETGFPTLGYQYKNGSFTRSEK